VIHQDEVGMRRRYRPLDLLQLAFANERGRIRPVTPLQKFPGDFCACRESQFAELGQRLLRSGTEVASDCASGFGGAERGRASLRCTRRNVKIAINPRKTAEFDSNQKRPLWLTPAGAEAG
jgi:hypothetical protein